MKEEKEIHVSEVNDLGKLPESSANADNTGSEIEEKNKEIQSVEPREDLTAEDSKVEEAEAGAQPVELHPQEGDVPTVADVDSSNESTPSEEAIETTEITPDPKAEVVQEEPPTATPSENKPDPEIQENIDTPESEDKTEIDSVDKEEVVKEIDYSTYSKEELVNTIIELKGSDDIMAAFRSANELIPHFKEIRKKEREEAVKAFISGGGEAADFEMSHDELTDRFEANLRVIRDGRSRYIKEKENEKETNYEKKLAVLEKLREYVDSDETNISFNSFKEIQEEWRAIGAVPQIHNKTLWANYHALIDRFYDNRSIYFELKELDRKRNLEQKIEICIKAEKLADEEVLKDAIIQLNELHEEFKHIGPVPKADQEPLWERFKAASDAVYSRRKAYVADLKVHLDENLALKKEICDKVEAFISFESDRIKKWNQKTAEILELQKEWEKIGSIPRSKAKEINKQFWGSFKLFFHNKNTFFKQLDAEREENLVKKKALVAKADELKESTDWIKTADEYKNLQKEWREIGPVPQKMREKIYAEFKSACDHFFDQRRANSSNIEADYQENLNKKEAICEQLEKGAGDKDSSKEILLQLEKEFNELGFVPKRSIKSISKRFKEAIGKYISQLPNLDAEEKEELILKDEINQISQGPNAERALNRKQHELRKEIGQLENDIALWKNNLEFFAASKTADKLREEFDAKIDKATENVSSLKKQLRLLRKVSG